MKSTLKLLLKYICLGCYFILALVIILEACMPGDVSANQSNVLTENITNKTGIGGSSKFIEPTNVKITTSQKIYNVGEIINISCDVLPQNASKKTIVYNISNEYNDIIELVSYGNVRFKKEGTAYIEVYIEGYENIKDIIKLEAQTKIIKPSSISIVSNTKVLNVSQEYQLYINFTPLDTTERKIKWHSSDESIAVIDENGIIKCLKQGVVTITASTINKVTTSLEFNIKEYMELPITKLELKPTTNYDEITNVLTINENEQIDLKKYLKIYPLNANNTRIEWSTNNQDVALITQDGMLYARYGNQNKIPVTVTASDDKSIKTQILVKVNSGITKLKIKNVDNCSLELNINSTFKLELDKETMPNSYEITYTVKDKDIITIDQAGIISGIKSGSAICLITCQSSDGNTTTLEINVNVRIRPKTTFYLFVRKIIGHFGSFLALALLASLVGIIFFKGKPLTIIISIILGLIIAGITELIQLDIPARTGSFKDVLIDFYGYLVGTIIVFGFYYLIKIIKMKGNKYENKENKLNNTK